MTTNSTYTTESNSAWKYDSEDNISVSYLSYPAKCYYYTDDANVRRKFIITMGSLRYTVFVTYYGDDKYLAINAYTNLILNLSKEKVENIVNGEDLDKIEDEAEYLYGVTYLNILRDANSEVCDDIDHRYFGISRLANVYADTSKPMLVIGDFAEVNNVSNDPMYTDPKKSNKVLESIKDIVQDLLGVLSRVDKTELLKKSGII